MEHATVPTIVSALARLDAATVEPFVHGSDEPIFVLSTANRSGSTLLQRILMTDPGLFLWGEPLLRLHFWHHLTATMARAARGDDFPPDRWLHDAPSGDLSEKWIATMWPSPVHLKRGLVALVDNWLGVPARQFGFPRWGFKAVILGAADAYLLRWLYPLARFVVIVRAPYDSYRSARPATRIIGNRTAAQFAEEWNRNILSWYELPPDFQWTLIKYEELIGGGFDFRKLERVLGLKLQETRAMEAKIVGTQPSGSTTTPPLTSDERAEIAAAAAGGLAKLGYG